jgi:hypothetical protein
MGRVRIAVAAAAALAAAVVVGPAFGGVHTMLITAGTPVVGSTGPGGTPASGFDVMELLLGEGEENAGGDGDNGGSGGDNGCSRRSLAHVGNFGHRHRADWTDRSEGRRHGRCTTQTAPSARPSPVQGTPPGLNTFHGLDLFDQRFGNGANDQFTVEPPDQGLCVGDGQVLEVVNNVIQSYAYVGTPSPNQYQTDGTSTSGPPESLNAFLGYPPAIVRVGELTIGPQVTDPSCIFDARAHKFIVVALTYDVVPTGDEAGNPTGPNRIDIAVTSSAAPTVAIQRYSIPTQNDGTASTPSHPNCPCIGDFPQLGMDDNGVYITTNEYPWFEDGFNGAQIYAMSRKQIEAGSPVLRVVQFDDLSVAGNPAFTIWPANSNEGDYNQQSFGTENFLSSMAAEEANGSGVDNRVAVWSLRYTKALDTPFPERLLRLDYDLVQTETYADPPPAEQKASDLLPLRDCLNDKTPGSPPAPPPPFDAFPCSLVLNGEEDPYKPEVEGPIATNDSRMLTNWYVQGTLIGALNTAVRVNGKTQTGIAWFSFDASTSRVLSQGYLAVANNNVAFPAAATLLNGKGAMGFTLTGRDWFPTAAYALVNVDVGRSSDDKYRGSDRGDRGRGGSGNASVGNPTVAFPGVGPQDGFSEYRYYSPTGDGVPRPRWGDYGGARSDGTSIWIANEYIGQSCSYEVWLATALRCGNTRVALGNWGTRITQVKP